MQLRITLIAAVFLLNGCANIGKDFSFNPADESALVVLAIDKVSNNNHTFSFVQVDLEQHKFLQNEMKHIITPNDLGAYVDELKPIKNQQQSMRFSAKKTKAGNYAFVSHKISNDSPHSITNCKNQFSNVYNLEKGVINVIWVSGKNYASPKITEVFEILSDVLSQYPNIDAEMKSAERTANIQFKYNKAALAPLFGGISCPLGDDFTIIENQKFPALLEE